MRAPRHKKNAVPLLKYKDWSLTENVRRDSCQNKDNSKYNIQTGFQNQATAIPAILVNFKWIR